MLQPDTYSRYFTAAPVLLSTPDRGKWAAVKLEEDRKYLWDLDDANILAHVVSDIAVVFLLSNRSVISFMPLRLAWPIRLAGHQQLAGETLAAVLDGRGFHTGDEANIRMLFQILSEPAPTADLDQDVQPAATTSEIATQPDVPVAPPISATPALIQKSASIIGYSMKSRSPQLMELASMTARKLPRRKEERSAQVVALPAKEPAPQSRVPETSRSEISKRVHIDSDLSTLFREEGELTVA